MGDNEINQAKVCKKPANTGITFTTDAMCRSMKEADLRAVLEECAQRGLSPVEFAKLADFEKMSPQLKKIAKQMNAEIKSLKIK